MAKFEEVFETDDSIAIFEEFVKQQGGKDNLKVNSDYQRGS